MRRRAKRDNLLAFGLPGGSKTRLICAIGHELIRHVPSVNDMRHSGNISS